MGFVQRNLPAIVLAFAGLLLLLGVFGYMQTQRDLPPRDFTILVDEQGSGYYRVAEQYRDLLRSRGVDLVIRPTTGASETLRLLQEGAAGSALVPGFLSGQLDPTSFSALGAVFDEPLWVFYNRAAFDGEPLAYLGQLQNRRLGVGLPGSGSQALALQLLEENGIHAGNTTLLEMPRSTEVEQLIAGEIDAVLLLDNYQSETVQTLLRVPEIGLANLAQVEAYAARQKTLKVVDLYEGVIDLGANIPAEDIRLLSSAGNLVIRDDLNPTLARTLMTAATIVHSGGDFFAKPYTYPDIGATELPVHREYVDFFNQLRSGNFFFTNNMPFWTAFALERFIFFLLPLVLLFGLLILYFPLLWRFYMQGKVLPVYKTLRQVEIALPAMDIADTEAEIMRLSKLETHVTQSVRVSAAYMPEVFHLRSHIRSVIVDLLRHREKLKDPDRADDHEDRVDANSVQARLDRLGGELADAGL
jgi:TRAP-type uncharacterized transport system substrate-binding protein